MINADTMYLVKNRSMGIVIYTIPEDNIRREFAPGETKRIPFRELEKLTYQAGGPYLMANYLQLDNEEAIQGLNISTENEYYMDEKQIIDLIRSGSYDEFVDALNFAPVGVIDLIKRFSVDLPIEDSRKREVLKEITGFDVDKAILNNKADKAPELPVDENQIQPITSQTNHSNRPIRRSHTNYKVVESKKTEEKTAE